MAPETGSASPPRVAPASLNHNDERYSLEWYSVEDLARLCRRSPQTIRSLMSRHQLPRRTAWQTYRRRRRRVMVVSRYVALWLQAVTLFRQPLEWPPR
jgi:hypothetical protein